MSELQRRLSLYSNESTKTNRLIITLTFLHTIAWLMILNWILTKLIYDRRI